MKLPDPNHPISITPVHERVMVSFHDTLIADTRHALELREASYPPVLYIPRQDILGDHYLPSDRQSHCPYKGDANYFTLHTVDGKAIDAAWSYESPFLAVAPIAGHVAFYEDKVHIARVPLSP
jgi:uncharacterized protein (DUF427 family)